MNTTEKHPTVESLTTLANAQDLAATDEKFTLLIDLLEISANHKYADELVNELQDALEQIGRNLA